MRHLLSLASALALAAPVSPQDPPVPPGGFPIEERLDRTLTWSDGTTALVDYRLPRVAGPATGWPVVVVLHGLGGTRRSAFMIEEGRQFARRGYVTVAYDARSTGGGDGRLRDLSDALVEAERALGDSMDQARVACTGKSMGGWTSFLAAAYSGRAMPSAGYRTTMQDVAAVMPDIQVLDKLEDTVPQSALIQTRTLLTVFQNQGPNSALIRAVQNEQYAALRRFYENRPGDNYLPLLQRSDVPMLVLFSQHDAFHVSTNNTDSFPTLPAATPWRYVVTTGAHNTPSNAGTAAYRLDTAARWADRFLKAASNGVDREPRFEWAIPPADPLVMERLDSVWQFRMYDAWPPAAASTRLYLRAGGVLDPMPPSADEGSAAVQNRPVAGYDVVGFLTDGAVPRRVQRSLPMSRADFTSAAYAAGAELAGRPRVRCDLEIPTNSFQLSASLWDVGPSGSARWLTMGTFATRTARPGITRIEIVLDDVAYRLPTGHRLRVALQNVPLRELPGRESYLVAPDFRAYDLRARLVAGFPAHVDLPIAPRPGAGLVPRLGRASAAAGLDHELLVDGGPTRGAAGYAILLGGSGIAPAGSFFGEPLRLVPDLWTQAGIASLGTPTFPGFLGMLDARGCARGRFVFPTGPDLAAAAGLILDFIVIGLEPAGAPFASAPARLVLDP